MAETLAMAPVVPPAALPERYEMLAELGRGGMGIVYQVRDRETGEIVALKFLKSEIAADAQILERFKNELRLAHKITHHNVARLYEFHRSGDTVYVSMEYIEGESLRALLQREGQLDYARGLNIARQLAAGVAEAHRQSIVHRDLKPENIMLTPAGELKVMDFGISRSYAAGVTATGAILGTPAYMAPEQAEGKPTDQHTDIYAMGLILYEMFTGAAAFSGETPVSVALKQVRERPQPPSKLAPGLPKHLEQTILKCLEKDPANRFQSVEEMLRALEGAPVREAPRAPRIISKRWIAIASAALLIATVLIAGLWWWRAKNADSVRLPIEKFTLSNSLPVVLSVDHSSPTFTLAVAYKAGARRDQPGHTGLALLMAHLMYQGSANVASGEHFSLVKRAGGHNEYGITPDSTHFVTTLPSNQLDLALFLEADRMRSLNITPSGVNAVRSYVLEQRADRENSPYGHAILRIPELAFSNFVNQQYAFGSVEDVKATRVEDAAKFYSTYYVPSNASLILVGDFEPKIARERIRHYFESIPARTAPPPPDTREPETITEKRQTMTDPSARVPVVVLAWRVPALLHSDWFAVKRLSQLLNANDASRLPASLVKAAGVASGIEDYLGNSGGPNLFWIALISVPGKDLTQLENLCLQEIERIGRKGVPPDEMDRLRTQALRRRALQLVSTASRASTFVEIFSAGAGPELINHWEDRERQISSEDLRRVIRQYINPEHRTVLTVTPAGDAR